MKLSSYRFTQSPEKTPMFRFKSSKSSKSVAQSAAYDHLCALRASGKISPADLDRLIAYEAGQRHTVKLEENTDAAWRKVGFGS